MMPVTGFNLFPAAGVPIVEVEPGTVIEHNGKTLTVTDTEAVSKDGTIYVTPRHLVAIKARCDAHR